MPAMASLEKDEKAVETTRQLFPVDSNASRRSSYFVEEDGLHYYSHPHHQTLFSSLLSILGSHQQDRRRCSYASVAGIEDAPPPFQFAESKPSISRRAMFLSILKRACIIVPVITLAILYVLPVIFYNLANSPKWLPSSRTSRRVRCSIDMGF